MSEEDKIGNLLTEWLEAFKRGDVTACANLYTEDGSMLPPDAEAVHGQAAIEALHREWLDLGETNKKITTVEVGVGSDSAYLVVNYSGDYPMEDGTTWTDVGKALSVLKRQPDGSWKFHITSLNSDKPWPV